MVDLVLLSDPAGLWLFERTVFEWWAMNNIIRFIHVPRSPLMLLRP